MRRDQDAEGVDREERWGWVSPHHLTRPSLGVWGSIVSFPSGVRGKAPAENGFYAYLRSERSRLEQLFQYFWVMTGPPKRRGARENFPSFPPSWRTWLQATYVTKTDEIIEQPLSLILSTFILTRQTIIICYYLHNTLHQENFKSNVHILSL